MPMSAEDIKNALENSTEDVPEDNQQCDFEPPIGAMPRMNVDAYFGILQKFVDAAAINSEASPVAIAANVISLFCASLNRYVYQWIGDTKIHYHEESLNVLIRYLVKSMRTIYALRYMAVAYRQGKEYVLQFVMHLKTLMMRIRVFWISDY
jgi:hypothetical protein